MRISVWMDDSASSGRFASEHGLSLFVESAGRKLLFDTGASGLFLRNARTLGQDPGEAELMVLSHGHNDHGGGLPEFLRVNHRAKAYLRRGAFEEHFSQGPDGSVKSIGIDPALRDDPRVVEVEGDFSPCPGLLLFSSVTGNRLHSRANDLLLVKEDGGFRRDPFLHEQNLLLTEGNKRVLLAGCAHRGIVNILERAVELAGGPMDAVVGGFHLSSLRSGTCEPRETVDGIADVLTGYSTAYYTCHCTGVRALEMLKEKMGDQVTAVAAGDVLEL